MGGESLWIGTYSSLADFHAAFQVGRVCVVVSLKRAKRVERNGQKEFFLSFSPMARQCFSSSLSSRDVCPVGSCSLPCKVSSSSLYRSPPPPLSRSLASVIIIFSSAFSPAARPFSLAPQVAFLYYLCVSLRLQVVMLDPF